MKASQINILFINPSAKMSGAEFSLMRLMASLDKRKYRPILLLPEPGPFQEKAEILGIETIILPQFIKFGEHFRWNKISKAWQAVCRLRRIIHTRKILLVHVNSPRAAYIGGLAARLSGVPSLIHVRDIYLSLFDSLLKSRLLGFVSDRIIAVSRATAAAILKVNPALSRKTEVIYNGFDMESIAATPGKDIRREWGLPLSARLIGSVGIIHPGKGQEFLIRAAARLKPLVPNLKLLLIGEVFHPDAQSYQAALEKLIANLGMGGDVILTGFRPDALRLIQDMDVFVHPAVYPDPLPGALIEAAALGKPIVATRVGGVPEIVEHEHSALLVEPGEVDSLATAILSLLNDTDKAERLARQARRRATGLFSIENYVAGICKLYEQLLEGKK